MGQYDKIIAPLDKPQICCKLIYVRVNNDVSVIVCVPVHKEVNEDMNTLIYSAKDFTRMAGLTKRRLMRWEKYGILRVKRILRGTQLERRFSESDIATVYWIKEQLRTGQSSMKEIRLINQLELGGESCQKEKNIMA